MVHSKLYFEVGQGRLAVGQAPLAIGQGPLEFWGRLDTTRLFHNGVIGAFYY